MDSRGFLFLLTKLRILGIVTTFLAFNPGYRREGRVSISFTILFLMSADSPAIRSIGHKSLSMPTIQPLSVEEIKLLEAFYQLCVFEAKGRGDESKKLTTTRRLLKLGIKQGLIPFADGDYNSLNFAEGLLADESTVLKRYIRIDLYLIHPVKGFKSALAIIALCRSKMNRIFCEYITWADKGYETTARRCRASEVQPCRM